MEIQKNNITSTKTLIMQKIITTIKIMIIIMITFVQRKLPRALFAPVDAGS